MNKEDRQARIEILEHAARLLNAIPSMVYEATQNLEAPPELAPFDSLAAYGHRKINHPIAEATVFCYAIIKALEHIPETVHPEMEATA